MSAKPLIPEILCPDCHSPETGDLDCPHCSGGGDANDESGDPCSHCDGAGYVEGSMECLDCSHVFDSPL